MEGGLRGRLGKLHLIFLVNKQLPMASCCTSVGPVQDCCGAEVEAACANPASGSVILLEARFGSDRFF